VINTHITSLIIIIITIVINIFMIIIIITIIITIILNPLFLPPAARSPHGWTAELIDISDIDTQPSPATTLYLLNEEQALPELKKYIKTYPGA
jgi:hypothetical protein